MGEMFRFHGFERSQARVEPDPLLAPHKGNNQATVDAANELGIKTLAYYPLAMGLLTDGGDKRTGALEHYAKGGTGFIGFPFLEKNQVKRRRRAGLAFDRGG